MNDDDIYFDLPCVVDGVETIIRAKKDEYEIPVVEEEEFTDA